MRTECPLDVRSSRGHVATVRVMQGTDGRLLSVERVSPSKDVEIDRAAIADVRAATELLPVPHRRRSLDATGSSPWELELEVSISPPIPMVSVELDEVLGLTDVRVPLDRRVWKRVRLVAVD